MALAFGMIALLYAAVGFGGGSSYAALLALAGTDYLLLPVIALVCNILVVSGGTWRFAREGQIDWRRSWPLLAASVPCAWLGGRLPVSPLVFVSLLGGALLVAGLLMIVRPWLEARAIPMPAGGAAGASLCGTGEQRGVLLAAGGGIGLLSGMVGIGGGIFLAPLLHLARWAPARAIAGTAALFILVNSFAGLAGQVAKRGALGAADLAPYVGLFVAVVVGGQIGSWLGATRLRARQIEIATAILVLFVAVRLLGQAAGMAA